MATITLDPGSIESYRTFLRIKSLPSWSIRGMVAEFPDEYAATVVGEVKKSEIAHHGEMSPFLFDYQAGIAQLALTKRKFAAFVDCGFGKTLIYMEWIRHVREELGSRKGILVVVPLMVVDQVLEEAAKFYPSVPVEPVASSDVSAWVNGCGGKVGITNYEAFNNDVPRGKLGALVIDESSMLKSHYGKWAGQIIETGKGIEWKLCGTGTPAPNDRIEYANHAVFLDRCPTVNSFLATYFVNRGQTQERWVLKDHALEPFYRALSHWCIFMTNPATYGWHDNTTTIPPINLHIHDVALTPEQRAAVRQFSGQLVATKSGGIATRGKMGQIAKGFVNGEELPTNKPWFIADQIRSWNKERSTLVWCKYNAEQDRLSSVIPDSVSITGSTPISDRRAMIRDFKAGNVSTLISKPKILGFGLNLQVATKQVFSTLEDSYEAYYQAVKRSNRVGSIHPLDVHVPLTEIEAPMAENVLEKAKRIQLDTESQERIFKQCNPIF